MRCRSSGPARRARGCAPSRSMLPPARIVFRRLRGVSERDEGPAVAGPRSGGCEGARDPERVSIRMTLGCQDAMRLGEILAIARFFARVTEARAVNVILVDICAAGLLRWRADDGAGPGSCRSPPDPGPIPRTGPRDRQRAGRPAGPGHVSGATSHPLVETFPHVILVVCGASCSSRRRPCASTRRCAKPLPVLAAAMRPRRGPRP